MVDSSLLSRAPLANEDATTVCSNQKTQHSGRDRELSGSHEAAERRVCLLTRFPRFPHLGNSSAKFSEIGSFPPKLRRQHSSKHRPLLGGKTVQAKLQLLGCQGVREFVECLGTATPGWTRAALSVRSFLFLHDKLYCVVSGCNSETDVTR